MEGSEEVQLYVSDMVSSVPRPLKELKGFKKVHLLSGNSETVTFTLSTEDICYYIIKDYGWIYEEGMIQICIGSSSRNIRFMANIISRKEYENNFLKCIYLTQNNGRGEV